MNRQKILIILPLLFSLFACNVRHLKQNQSVDFDQIKEVDYAAVNRYVFQPNCVSCHGNARGINLESYANIKASLPAIENVVFKTKSMPKDAPLDISTAQLLRRWIDQGAVEGIIPAPTPTLEAKYSSIRDQIFISRCLKCHSASGEGKNVILDNYQLLLNSPRDLVLPGNVEESGLWIAITRDDDKQMPPSDSGGKKLNEVELGVIRTWITDGGKDN